MQGWLRSNGGPLALVVVGLGIVGLQTPVAWSIVGVGVVWFVFTLAPVQRRVPWAVVRKAELGSDFWQKVFEALPPPAFVKEYPKDAHVRDNQALRTFQGLKPTGPAVESDELQSRICADHVNGDKKAADSGESAQLELTDPSGTKRPRPILTFKAKVVHDDRVYIVGWYLPVKLPKSLPADSTMEVVQAGGQVLFQHPEEASDDGHHVVVDIGESIRLRQGSS